MSFKRVSNQAIIRPRAPMIYKLRQYRAPIWKINVQYPQTWFDENPGIKPILSIQLLTKDITKIRGAVRLGIRNNNIKLNTALTFLYLFAEGIEETLDHDWKSYERTIGKAGEKITPLSLLEIKSTINPEEIETTEMDDKSDSWMALYLLSVYRMIRASVSEYKAAICLKISTQLKTLNADAPQMTDSLVMYRCWEHNKAFNTLVAMYDMFFHKFPLNELANMRIATTGSRHKDCAALISYSYLLKILGMNKPTDILDWVFVEQIADDIERMMVASEELDLNEFSYFPYQVDMGLVLKSAFSASANPYFFQWVHLIGAMFKQTRSMNARRICDHQEMNIFLNATCVAYVYSHRLSIGKVRFTTDEALSEEGIFKSRSPAEWLKYLQSTDNLLPEKMKKYVKAVARSIKDSRKGSINNYLATVVDGLV